MPKIFYLIPVILFIEIFFILSRPIIALSSNITKTINPNPVFTNSDTATITVTSDQDDFDPSVPYSYQAQNTSRNANYCLSSIGSVPSANISARQITVSWKIQNCTADIGTWKFQIWVGHGTIARTPQSLIGSDLFFELQPAGGQNPSVTALNQNLSLSDIPVVSLNNAVKENTYTFWWNGATMELAQKVKASSTGKNINVQLNKTGVDFSKPETKKICMDVGDYPIPAPLTCKYFDFFNFSALPSHNDNVSCSANPASPNTEDNVSFKAINLPKNIDFRADLNEQHIPDTQNSRDTGTINITLGSKLTLGDYSAFLFRLDNNDFICSIQFSVGEKPPPGSGIGTGVGITECKKPGEAGYDRNKNACSSAAGQGCREGRGIDTAIGCIPTHPVELVRGFVRFAIGIAGGIALLLMIFGAFTMITSAGNPDRINEGRERFSSAIIGLLVIIFAVLLMRLIGVDILGLDRFLGV